MNDGAGSSASAGPDGSADAGDGQPDPGGTGPGDGEVPLFDVDFDEETDGPQGCSKIDFLFVIDNSGSMVDEQESLVRSFPGFIDAIQQSVAAQDYRIMVTDTKGPPCDCGTVTCADDAQLIDECVGLCNQFCGGIGCNVVSGAAVDYDNLGNSCNFASGMGWMTHEEPDLETAFSCAANLADGSSTEHQAGATLAAVLGGDGAMECAGGQFIRDDAILVVTVITDEEDRNSPGEPQQWHDTIIAAKGDDGDAVVLLALVGDSEVPGGLCTWDGVFGAEDAPRLRSFVDTFGGLGLWASVCEPDYAPFFQQAVGLVDEACQNFPAG